MNETQKNGVINYKNRNNEHILLLSLMFCPFSLKIYITVNEIQKMKHKSCTQGTTSPRWLIFHSMINWLKTKKNYTIFLSCYVCKHTKINRLSTSNQTSIFLLFFQSFSLQKSCRVLSTCAAPGKKSRTTGPEQNCPKNSTSLT